MRTLSGDSSIIVSESGRAGGTPALTSALREWHQRTADFNFRTTWFAGNVSVNPGDFTHLQTCGFRDPAETRWRQRQNYGRSASAVGGNRKVRGHGIVQIWQSRGRAHQRQAER